MTYTRTTMTPTRMPARTARRFVVMGGPGGQLTTVVPGSPLHDRYRDRRWVELFRFAIPRSRPRGLPTPFYAHGAALRRFELA